ncbi:hypothetical protein R6242_21015 [Iodobacter sp. CM08]|uniref:hypothetical protein n=1 Tax=Iodobacter sp. CM08 TaxID=3085902 RepID=UPI00298220D6|nr:hypothetical protein [Iodobacter sp. CM08]MDW5419056.1 hypothetical protein [Iodobacter sp. CM08]
MIDAALSYAAGGGSILAKAGVRGRGIGYGAGAAGSASSPAGGGGEGVARFKVDVTPGETLLFSAGLPMANMATISPNEPTCGHIHFEFI